MSDDVIDSRLAAELLQRQAELQATAGDVLADLDLVRVLSQAGDVTLVGSYVTGLMSQPDIDVNVVCDTWSAAAAFEAVRPLVVHPRVRKLSYDNQTGAFNPGFPLEGYYWGVQYENPVGLAWKLDVWFWPRRAPSEDIQHTQELRRRLTPETRLAILWIKDALHRQRMFSAYRVSSVDIYDAVLKHGVRTPATFGAHLATPRRST